MFNIFKKKDEVVCPKIKGGRYLADINDVPDPVNEQTPELIRIMNKFKEIIDDPSDWTMITNEDDRDGRLVDSNGFMIRVQYIPYIEKSHSFQWPQYKYLASHYGIYLHSSVDSDYIFDSIEIVYDNFIWMSKDRKLSEEGIIINKCFSIFEKIEEEKKQKKDDELRRKFYKQT